MEYGFNASKHYKELATALKKIYKGLPEKGWNQELFQRRDFDKDL